MTTKKKLSIMYCSTLALVVIYLLLRVFFMTFAEVKGHSMDPTLQDGEVLLCKRVHSADDYQVGDIVIARANGKRVVKRVAGKPGDVNVMSVDEKTVVCEDVPEDSVFLLGDNAAVSLDSRDFGPVKCDKVLYVWTGFRTTETIWYSIVGAIIFIFVAASSILEYKVSKEEKAAKAAEEAEALLEKGGIEDDGSEETHTDGSGGTAGTEFGKDGGE